MVFDSTGTTFHGTELLIRADLYQGQPCPQDNLDEFESVLDGAYFACHHFDRSAV